MSGRGPVEVVECSVGADVVVCQEEEGVSLPRLKMKDVVGREGWVAWGTLHEVGEPNKNIFVL